MINKGFALLLLIAVFHVPSTVKAQLAIGVRCACGGAEVVEKSMMDELRKVRGISIVPEEEARLLLSVVAVPMTVQSSKAGYAYALTVILKLPVPDNLEQENQYVFDALASNGIYLTQYVGTTGLKPSGVRSSVADFVRAVDNEVFLLWRQ